ncbi:hypothetical protein LCGC14_2655510 [marine sediment metagenome]|uniref:Uncharacterized protein n=1 Tax=marine sediment metagenome TaxID=412755 RepID=A0A0F9C3W4_9ZZZZ
MGRRSANTKVKIPTGDTESSWQRCCANATHVMVMGPATLEARTYTIEVTDNPDASSVVVRTLQTDIVTPANVALPVADVSKPMRELIGCLAFRLKSNGAITDEDEATWHFDALEDY